MENNTFKIETLHDVNSVLKTIKNLELKKEEYRQFAAAEMEKIEKWLEEVTRPLDNSIEFYTGELTAYYIAQKRENPKLKTISVPNGKFKCRTTKKLNYDEVAMLNYLKENHSGLVETVEKFNKSEVKKIFDGNVDKFTGEIIDFIEEEEITTYSVKTAE